MTPTEVLITLAIDASEHEDAVPVLHDALVEAGWESIYVPALLLGLPVRLMPEQWREGWRPQPDRRWARAVLAVLLFGEWEGPWVLSYRSYPPWIVARRAEADWPLFLGPPR